MRHVFRLERILDGVVVETIKPKEAGAPGARRHARKVAESLSGGRAFGPSPIVRVFNVTKGTVLVTYRRGSRDRAVKV